MTIKKTTIAAPFSLLLVMDRSVGEVPEDAGAVPIVAGPSCVAVGTLSEIDGETDVHVVLAEEFPSPGSELSLAWSGSVASAGVMEVLTVDLKALLTVSVRQNPTLEIWTNDPDEPDDIWVVVR